MNGAGAPTLSRLEAADGDAGEQPIFGSAEHIEALEALHPGKVAFFLRHRVPSEAFPHGFEAVLLADRERAIAAYREGKLLWNPGEVIDIREARA